MVTMFLQLGNIIACTVVFCHFVLCIVTYNNWSENSAKKNAIVLPIHLDKTFGAFLIK